MATITGAIKSSLDDPWWIVKLIFSVYLVYFLIHNVPTSIPNQEAQIVVYAIAGLFFLGCATCAMSRNINNKYPLFPGIINIYEIVVKTIGGFFAILPGTILACVLLFFFNTMQLEEEVVKYIIYVIIGLLTLPLIIIPLVLYSATEKLTKTFNFGIIFGASGNVIMSIALLVLQAVFIYGISYTCFYFFFAQMFNPEHIVINILTYTFAVIIYFTSMIYLSDLYDDVIPAVQEEEIKEEK